MSISNLSFQLKPSKVAWFFQFGLYLLLLSLSALALPWYGCLLLLVVAAIAWGGFVVRQPKIERLAQLDRSLWSIKKHNLQRNLQLNLKQVIDHQFYIVLFWNESKESCVIWCDQVGTAEWKQLRLLAKLYRASAEF